MRMWFHGGHQEVVLFDWWRIDSCCGMYVGISNPLLFADHSTYVAVNLCPPFSSYSLVRTQIFGTFLNKLKV